MSDPRVCFAAERTLLAWVRSGLTMMAFGFVVARFGLFLALLPASNQSAGSTHMSPRKHLSLELEWSDNGSTGNYNCIMTLQFRNMLSI